MLKITPRFYPVRVIAFIKNETEMDISVENKGSETYWVETDVILPDELSLSDEKQLKNGRLRVGMILPNETKTSRCKIYANSQTCPGLYRIGIIGYSFNKEGIIARKDEAKTELRCARVGEK
jgi:hypothetical protein